MREPPIDAHAHLLPNLSPREVDGIRGAFIMAVTRSPSEWGAALRRHDRRIAWGLGCHPGDAVAVEAFNPAQLARVASRAPFLGEVGLDGRSKVPLGDQERVLSEILRVAAGEGIIVSLHSTGHAETLLDLVEASACTTAILHWWGGSTDETARAIGLGCHFSVNASMRDDALARLPRERVVTETDFPSTRSRDRSIDRPGAVGSIERRLASAWGVEVDDVRASGWAALRALDSLAGRLAGATARIAGDT